MATATKAVTVTVVLTAGEVASALIALDDYLDATEPGESVVRRDINDVARVLRGVTAPF
jgi:hypothetical protein